MTPYLERINQWIAGQDEEIRDALEEVSVVKTYPKGSYLLKEGQVSGKSYHIINGVARKYYDKEEKEITTEFFFPGDLALSFDSYTLQQPGHENIECLTALTVSVTGYAAFESAKRKYPALLQLELLLTELYASWLEERLFELRTCDATQRYHKLLEKAPHILQQVQLTHIASYLGISLETLSRIRARR